VPLKAVMVTHPSVWTTLGCYVSVRGVTVFTGQHRTLLTLSLMKGRLVITRGRFSPW